MWRYHYDNYTGRPAAYPDPFQDYATRVLPTTIHEAFRRCEQVMDSNGTYRAAILRVLAYFLTEPVLGDEDVGDDEKNRWGDFLEDTVSARVESFIGGMNLLTYGNEFLSVLPPFRRYLTCSTKGCGSEYPLEVALREKEFQFRFTGFQYHARCPKCKQSGIWKSQDRRLYTPEAIRIQHWPVYEIDVINEPIYGKCRYRWRIPAYYRQMIREGHPEALPHCPQEVIQAISMGGDLEFAEDMIYHMKMPGLSGVRMGGWGFPPVLTHYGQAWYVAVLQRLNEAIAMDYIVPMRVVSPAQDKDPISGPMRNASLPNFMAFIRQALRRHRHDPGNWITSPWALNYQILGGDAKNLAPFELLDQGNSVLLNSVGVPVEFFKGSLQTQWSPAAIRLFESHWSLLCHQLNQLLRFIVQSTASLLSWQNVKSHWGKPTVLDDIQKQGARLQMMASADVSRTEGLRSVGLDWRAEYRKRLEEERFMAEQQARMQEEMDGASFMQTMVPTPQQQMQQQQQAGAQPPGGMPGMPGMPGQDGGAAGAAGPAGPAAPGTAAGSFAVSQPTLPNQKISPQEMFAKAQQEAYRFLSMSEGERQSALTRLKHQDPSLHSVVRSVIDDLRQQAQSQGGRQIMQQQFGGT